jgi:hypothetical protein
MNSFDTNPAGANIPVATAIKAIHTYAKCC